jgi:hypothetical protein
MARTSDLDAAFQAAQAALFDDDDCNGATPCSVVVPQTLEPPRSHRPATAASSNPSGSTSSRSVSAGAPSASGGVGGVVVGGTVQRLPASAYPVVLGTVVHVVGGLPAAMRKPVAAPSFADLQRELESMPAAPPAAAATSKPCSSGGSGTRVASSGVAGDGCIPVAPTKPQSAVTPAAASHTPSADPAPVDAVTIPPPLTTSAPGKPAATPPAINPDVERQVRELELEVDAEEDREEAAAAAAEADAQAIAAAALAAATPAASQGPSLPPRHRRASEGHDGDVETSTTEATEAAEATLMHSVELQVRDLYQHCLCVRRFRCWLCVTACACVCRCCCAGSRS